MNFHSSGWLKRYLQYRAKEPFVLWGGELPSIFIPNAELAPEVVHELDDILYNTLRQSGVLFGCPILDKPLAEGPPWFKYFGRQDQANFVYIETLFLAILQEIVFLAPHLGSQERFLARATIRVLQFYLRQDIDSKFFEMDIHNLLESLEFIKLLKQGEKLLLDRIKIQTNFSFLSSLRNNFAFLDIYSLIAWDRKFHGKFSSPIHYLSEIEYEYILLQKQLILVFSALLWQTSQLQEHAFVQRIFGKKGKRLPKQKDRMLRNYINASRLGKIEKYKLAHRIQEPVNLSDINMAVSENIINKYMVEQVILLSMIDNEASEPQERFIKELTWRLEMGAEAWETCEGSVAEFFVKYEDRFDFIRGNRSLYYMQSHIYERVTIAVQKNRDRLMNEIEQTGRLYSVLMKATQAPLTTEEKQFARTQLLSIAKTVPAVAIFCLPAGGVVLAVLLKVLPFNILPDSFAD